MALQVTGDLSIPYKTSTFYKNPLLVLNPTLGYRNKLSLTIPLLQSGSINTNGPLLGGIIDQIYFEIQPADLEYPAEPINPYADMIYALETYTINQLKSINPDCSFERI